MTVNVDPSGSGAVSLNNTGPYHYGDVVQLTAVPVNSSWSFSGWSGDLGGSSNPENILIDGNKNVNAAFSQLTYLIHASAGPGGSILPSGDVTVTYGGDQDFTFTPEAGYNIEDVMVDSVSQGPLNYYNFTNVVAEHWISVSFVPNAYTITASSGPGGTIDPSGLVAVGYGNDQAFVITPYVGFHIGDVLVDGGSIGVPSTYTFYSVTADHTITVLFSLDVYTLTVNVNPLGAGIVSRNYTGPYHYGDVVQLTATPYTGYTFTDWSGDLTGTTNPASIIMDASHTITASFAIQTFTITATASSGGSISPPGSVIVNYGGSQTFTITADPGYSIASVLVDGVSQGAIGSITFSNVQADHTISATFTLPASKLVYTTGASQSLTIGQVSSVITVQRQDSNSNPVTSEGTITVILTTSATISGRFYSDAGGTTQITSVQILSGQSSASFYYADSTAGTPTLTASSGSLTPATTTFTINNYKLVYTAGAGQTRYTGAMSQQITVQRQNANGNPRSGVTGITVTLTTSSSSGKFYSDASGNNQITSVYISYSSSTASFYYRDTSAGTPTLTASSNGYTPATTVFTIQLPTSRLVYTVGAPQTLIVDALSGQITVQRQDQNGIPITSGTTTVDLISSSLGGRFYSNAGGTNEITSVNIGSGSTANFYYRDFTAGSPTLTASSVGFISVTSQFTITGQSEPHYNTTMTPTSVGTGTTVTFTYRITLDTSQDVDLGYVNITVPAGFTIISVNTPTSNVGTWSRTVSGNLITLTADGFGDELEDRGDWVQVVFTATAPSSTGTYQFTSGVYEHTDLTGIGQGTNTGSDPTVTVYIPVSITITSSPAGSGFVIVDGNPITTPTIFYWEQGSTHSLQANSPVSGGTGVQYVYIGWDDSGAQTHNYIVPSSSATITANYKTQYRLYVTSAQDSPNPSAGANWYDPGTSITANVTSPAGQTGGTRYRCTGWTGTGNVPLSGTGTTVTFTISQASTITWNWVTQYRLTVASDHDAPSPSVGDNWYDPGTSITASVTSPVDEAGIRYRCTGRTGTGSVSTGSGTSVTFTISQASSITWNWVAQYQVSFAVTPSGSGTTSPSGTNVWEDAGSLSISATSNSGYIFSSWSATG
ncbi:MAG: hypothetical protein WAW96_01445, partial [Alphaproteobacteria bacterium]